MHPHRPKPAEKFFFLISGAIISAPFPIVIYSLTSYFLAVDYSQSAVYFFIAAILAPLLEEFAKAYPLFYRHGETEKSLITLGFLAGLGFGLTEFLFYVFVLQAPFYSRIIAVIFHATNTAIVSYGISKYRALPFYLIAVLLHFINNFSIMTGFGMLGGIVAPVTSIVLASYLYRSSTEKTIDWL